MRSWISSMVAGVGMTCAASAAADEPGAFMKFEVETADPKAPTCTTGPHESSPTRKAGKVEFELPPGVVLERVVIHRGLDADKLADIEFKGEQIKSANGVHFVELSRNDADDIPISAELGLKDLPPVACGKRGEFRIFKAAPPPPAPRSSLDTEAQEWWIKPETYDELIVLKNELVARGMPKDTELLVHLPSGLPAAPTPSALTEGKPIQVVIISDATKKHEVSFDVKSCEDVDPFRTQIDAKKAAEQSKSGAEPKTHFFFFPIGQWLTCGTPSLDYTLTGKLLASEAAEQAKPAAPAAPAAPKPADPNSAPKDDAAKPFLSLSSGEYKVRMRPKYHLAAIAALGFDTSKRKNYVKNTDRSVMPSTVSVAEQTDQIGFQAYVGAQWMVGGVDYHDMNKWNYFANLFVAVDPTSPLDDILAGIAITPTGGASLALGIGLHKTNRLKDYDIGDPFTGDGDIPTETTWSGFKPGLYVGLALDSNVYEALIKRFSAK